MITTESALRKRRYEAALAEARKAWIEDHPIPPNSTGDPGMPPAWELAPEFWSFKTVNKPDIEQEFASGSGMMSRYSIPDHVVQHLADDGMWYDGPPEEPRVGMVFETRTERDIPNYDQLVCTHEIRQDFRLVGSTCEDDTSLNDTIVRWRYLPGWV